MKQAPLYTDTLALTEWLLGHFDQETSTLARRLCTNALSLLEALALALKDRLREERVEEADERLITLRLQLRLMGLTERLNDKQLRHALELADQIGRQLGGWRRSMDNL